MSGVIPQSNANVVANPWGKVPLSSLAERIMVGIASAATHAYRAKGIPMFRNQNIKAGNLDDSDLLFIAPEYESAFKNKRLRAGDLLTMRTGYPGVTAIVPPLYEQAQSFTTLITRPKRDCIHSAFLCHYINSEFGQKFFEQSQIGGAQKNVNAGTLRGMPIPLPPSLEQKAIATALSHVDALIAGLDRLIAKKRDIKQAAMQQLLTGQTRLPGFSGVWDRVELRKLVLTPITDGPHMTPRFSESGVPFLSVNNLVDNRIDLSDLRYISDEDDQLFSKKCKPKVGDVLLGKAASVGKVAIVEEEFNFNIWSPIALVRAGGNILPKFLFYQLLSADCVGQVALLTNSSSQGNIGMGDIEKLQISYPKWDEQTAIAAVLSDMDADLSALKSRLVKTRAIKQGMVQELLTGRTRLVDSVEQSPVQKMAPAGERKANVYFMRSVLAAEIVDQLHEEPTFGHVKFEKLMFLAEHLCHVDTGSHYARKAAGPLDRKALHSIDKQLRDQKWFDVRKEKGRYRYVPLEKRGGHKSYFDRYFASIGPQLSEILDTFRSWETERCEIVATLYAAWDDLLKENGSVSDDLIVHEVLNNWHESKQRIPEERWLKALVWMREKGYVPGRIVSTVPP